MSATLLQSTPPALELHIPRPTWRGRMHTWAAVAAVPAGALLVVGARQLSGRLVASVFVASLMLSFGTSAAYHRLARSERARAVMRRFDHAMIFVLIGGTYVPICVVALPQSVGRPLLVAVGAGCLIGVVLKLVAFHRLRWVGYAMYPVLGWASVIAAPSLAAHLSGAQLALIVAGGLAYTGGMPVLFAHRPNPWPASFGYHEVWHACTVFAAACHFAAIALIVC
jgi:hemolysin III